MRKELLSNGNKKIGRDTLIFNMSSAHECASRKLGLCTQGNKCYAMKAERCYKNCIPFRTRQEAYWSNTSSDVMVNDLKEVLSHRRKPIKYFRWNESGDLTSNACIDKVFALAEAFKGINFYMYTHRHDLLDKLKNRPKNLAVMASNKVVKGFNSFLTVTKYSKGALRCKGNCRTCNLCKSGNNRVIECLVH
jgi:hypothetical protein